jgi:hypothetical protein
MTDYCDQCRQPSDMAHEWFTITHETDRYNEEFCFCRIECLREWITE